MDGTFKVNVALPIDKDNLSKKDVIKFTLFYEKESASFFVRYPFFGFTRKTRIRHLIKIVTPDAFNKRMELSIVKAKKAADEAAKKAADEAAKKQLPKQPTKKFCVGLITSAVKSE
jgi:hypothetical protein